MKKFAFFAFAFAMLGSLLSMSPALAVIDGNDPLGLSSGRASGLGEGDVRDTAASIINIGLTLLGTIALVFTVYAGFLWMTAGGNDDQIGKAKGIL
ncbi:MAG: hypothetical protein COU33_04735, partial [Candidatus Magasanikbacteria bacterium CG10_big_fil_rev_8_21_14_0_10_43_6]